MTEICLEVGFTSLGTFSRTFTRDRGPVARGLPARVGSLSGAHLLRHGLDATEQFRRSEVARRGLALAPMFNAITHHGIFVLDQDEALDFYVGKLGLEVAADVDLGFMRWLTVDACPATPSREILLERPGPPAHSDEAAADRCASW